MKIGKGKVLICGQGSLVLEQALPEAGGGLRPHVSAGHRAVLVGFTLRSVECFPTELEAFVHISTISGVIVAAQNGVVSLEVALR